jgi:hypothetical protein
LDQDQPQPDTGQPDIEGRQLMARYDWPSPPFSTDDSPGRHAFNSAYRPAANERLPDGSLAPVPEAPKARRSRRGAKAAPKGGQDLWLPIGPTTVMAGQATGRPQISGRIRDLAIDSNPNDRVYAATAGGGVWFSANSGASWNPIDGFVVSPNRTTVTPVGSALSCGALYVNFGTAASGADDEIYVGSGEPSDTNPGGNPGGNLLGVGILKRDNPTGEWRVDPGGEALRGHFVCRIVASPLDKNHLFAATSAGVYHRPAGMTWMKLVAGGVVDVLVTPDTTTSVKVWVATLFDVSVGTLHLPIAAPPPPPTAPPLLAVTPVTLNNVMHETNKAMALGAPNELWVLGRRDKTGTETFEPAHLWRIDPTVASPTAVEITGVPADLFGQPDSQAFYDICIVAHPEAPHRLYVGGSGTTKPDNAWNAGLYILEVSGTTATPTLTGMGVHADVHIIRIGPRVVSLDPDRAIWVGCDGGVFRSAGDGRPGTFFTRNNELATLEPGYVACHPTNDGVVAAGMQDNGTCERRGDSIWALTHMGDGGGTVYDPSHEHRFYRQYINAHWESSDGTGTKPVLRRNDRGPNSSETIENKAALFYSGASALAHGGTTHLLIATGRPWYSADWGAHWVTVPSGNDPRATDNADLEHDLIEKGTVTGKYTDTFPIHHCCRSDTQVEKQGDNIVGSPVITTRLSAADDGATTRIRAHCLWGGGLAMFLGTKPATAGAPWTWAKEVFEEIRPTATPAEQTVVESGVRTQFLPARRVTDVAVHLPGNGAHGSCYITTLGQTGKFDSLGNLLVETVDTVWWYDGEGNFVPCGVRNTKANSSWSDDRIVAPAMAVVVDPIDPNIVFVGTSIGVIRGVLSMPIVDGVPKPHWDWRPFDNGLPETAVNDLAIFSDGTLHLLRAALHGRGVWEVDLKTVVAQERTYLRVLPSDTRRRDQTPLSGPATHGETNLRYDSSPDIVIDRTSIVDVAGGPTEADLFERGNGVPVGQHAASQLSERSFRVHVLVHHRWPFEATPAQVKVVLLRKDMIPGVDDPPLGGIWSTLVDLAGGTPAPTPLPGSWEKAGTQMVRPISSATDARRPRAATFDINLAGHDAGRVMLMAVVMSAPDPIGLPEGQKPDNSPLTTLSELVLQSRHVAARSIELI